MTIENLTGPVLVDTNVLQRHDRPGFQPSKIGLRLMPQAGGEECAALHGGFRREFC